MGSIRSNMMIAGADGMIGKSLVKLLASENQLTTIGFYSNSAEITYSGDLSQKEFSNKIASTCEPPDTLVFLVGLAHSKGKGADYDLFEQVNFQTLLNLLEALKVNNKLPGKIVFASTVSVYGERKEVSVYDESTATRPFSPYAVTKLKAEEYLLKNYKERSWGLRFAPAYSNDFRLNIDRRSAIGRFNYKVGNGEQRMSLCNLKNIQASLDGIINEKVPCGIYNISDETDYSYNALLKSISAEKIIRIPKFIPHSTYYLGLLSKNIFLRENSLKLIKDNVFPSAKIRKYIDLPYNIGDLSN